MRPWKVTAIASFSVLAFVLSIVAVVSIARHTAHSSYVLSKVTSAEMAKFPSLLVCPTYVPEKFIPPSDTGVKPSFSVSVVTSTPAFVNNIDEVGDGYPVCGKTVTFIDPKHNECSSELPREDRDCRMYECINIDGSMMKVLTPEQVGSREDATCEFDASIMQKLPFAYTLNDGVRSMHAYDLKDAWTANRTSATLQLETSLELDVFTPNTTSFLLDFPVQVMLYGDKTEALIPNSFAEFEETFSLTSSGASLLSFYTKSVMWVLLERGVKQRDASKTKNLLGKKSVCDVDTWESSRVKDYTRGMAASGAADDALMMIFSFGTLDTKHTCYESIFDATDGIGLFGGFLAIFGCCLVLGIWVFKLYKRVCDGALGSGMDMQSALLGYDDDEPLFQ